MTLALAVACFFAGFAAGALLFAGVEGQARLRDIRRQAAYEQEMERLDDERGQA